MATRPRVGVALALLVMLLVPASACTRGATPATGPAVTPEVSHALGPYPIGVTFTQGPRSAMLENVTVESPEADSEAGRFYASKKRTAKPGHRYVVATFAVADSDHPRTEKGEGWGPLVVIRDAAVTAGSGRFQPTAGYRRTLPTEPHSWREIVEFEVPERAASPIMSARISQDSSLSVSFRLW
jgi:hypothetical protein